MLKNDLQSDTEELTKPNLVLQHLNQPQMDAVMHMQGPLLVLAGAGTGKTRVLTNRIANIVLSGLAAPNNILAVTFTNKAAKEMMERVNTLLPNTSGLSIGTFHSVAAKIIRDNAEYAKLDRFFNIIDSDDQQKLVKTVMTELNKDIKKYSPKNIVNIISKWKDMGLYYDDLSQCDLTSDAHKIAYSVYIEYQNRLIASNNVDFGDLLLYNNKLFSNYPEILAYYQRKFAYILVDEYQDTNPAQYIWLRMLADAHKNICCVGDDDQSIYSWRGADVNNILRFEKDFASARIIKLEQNYRSTPAILSASKSLIMNNKRRHTKALWTEAVTGEPVRIVSCYNDKEEAAVIMKYITHLQQRMDVKLSNIAILVRAAFQTRLFEEALILNGIRYSMIGGMKFYERMEIKDALAYIRLIISHNDDISFERIINVPKRSVGDVTLKSIRAFANENKCSMFDAVSKMVNAGMFTNRLSVVLHGFVTSILRWQDNFCKMSAGEATKIVMEESGYFDMLKAEKTEESKARLDNLRDMISNISEFDNIVQFLEHISLVSDNDTKTGGNGTNNQALTEDAVKIMTLHSAKGLEFDVVFMPGMEEGLFPHAKSIQEQHLEEERRIAYVGITRAKKYLVMTYAKYRYLFYERVESTPSRFLSEIPQNCRVLAAASKGVAL